MSDSTPTESKAATETQAPRPYRTERRVVGTVFLAGVIALIVNGSWQIHQDTFREPSQPSEFAKCSPGIATLFRSYVKVFDWTQPTVSGELLKPVRDRAETKPVLRLLDEQLLALRAVCEREGAGGREAIESFAVWRYQLENVSHLQDTVLVPEARRALQYHSPGVTDPAVKQESSPHVD